jgi:hypothetical protein
MSFASLIEPNTTLRPPLNLAETFKATFGGENFVKKERKMVFVGEV